MRIQHSLPLLDLAHPLLAPQVLFHIRRPRRVVDLVPVRLALLLLRRLLLALLGGLAAAALALFLRGVEELVVVVRCGPVG